MKHASITKQIIGVFFDVYNELGSGFLESVYVEALSVALVQAGLFVGKCRWWLYFAGRLSEVLEPTSS